LEDFNHLGFFLSNHFCSRSPSPLPLPCGERGRVRGANLKNFDAFVLVYWMLSSMEEFFWEKSGVGLWNGKENHLAATVEKLTEIGL
jgi:hypothetical protein